MPALSRWICLRALTRPWAWGLLLLTCAAWPLSRRLFQLGLANWDRDLFALALEAGTLAGFLGTLLGLAALGATEELAGRLPPLRRFAQEALALVALQLGFQLVGALGVFLPGLLEQLWAAEPHAHGAGDPNMLNWAQLALQLATTDAHLCMLALLLSRLGMRASLLPGLLFALVWVAPPLISPASAPGRLCLRLLAVRPHLDGRSAGRETLHAQPQELVVILSLAILALALSSPFGQRR